MRNGVRGALLLVIALAAGAGAAATASATTPAPTAAAETWSPDLDDGDPVGLTVRAGAARFDRGHAPVLPADDGALAEGAPGGVPTGLLTLPVRDLDAPTDRVAVEVEGDLPAGAAATVDVRGRRPGGGWTEWAPAEPGGTAVLPEPASQVQPRLVVTAGPGAEPEIRGLTLRAGPATTAGGRESTEADPRTYRVFATREGLVGGTTANGHVIRNRDHFVALPSRRALSPRGTTDYSVKVCAAGGRCAFAPVWDVGPWNIKDDYWNPSAQRQQWADLPQGLPQAQAAREQGYNGGKDGFGRPIKNPAGIDLGDGLFWDALGLRDNAWVTVDYLWTGDSLLAQVGAGAPVEVRAAPDAAAAVVGLAADRAAVPVECVLDVGDEEWLKIGDGQFLPAAAVAGPGGVGACPGSERDRAG